MNLKQFFHFRLRSIFSNFNSVFFVPHFSCILEKVTVNNYFFMMPSSLKIVPFFVNFSPLVIVVAPRDVRHAIS